ncbi:MAG: cytotoxic translational repressor of toxin-antitoxin stability system [Thermodesulfobacteriota bacterium]
MDWTVRFRPKAAKQTGKLPDRIKNVLRLLVEDIEEKGPVQGGWPNYGKLTEGRHHCHLKKGRPTYVAVWEESAQGIRLIEVTYVGTHEKAPY